MIIGAAAVQSINASAVLRSRCGIISELIAALKAMESEICDRLTPLPELFAELGEGEGAVGGMFKNCLRQMSDMEVREFHAVWKSAVKATPELMLKEQEEKELIQLGRYLGRYDVEEQRMALQYAAKRFEEFLRKAERERETQGRTRAAMGISAGVTAVILLL